MSNKDKFTFVNDIESDIEDVEETINKEQTAESEESKFPGISEHERSERIKVVKTILIVIIVSAAIFAFTLFWQDDVSLMGICDALWLVVIIEFFVGWILLINNLRVFSPLIYGAKSFGRMLLGKRMDDDYYTYLKMKEDNPVPRFYYRICFISALIIAVPATVLLFIVM